MCFMRILLNIPCPGCGSTRAVLALLRGNIAAYFYYNAMTLPMIFALVVCAFKKLSRCRVLRFSSYAILGMDIFYYVLRLFNGFIP